jgi:hypothetical protein
VRYLLSPRPVWADREQLKMVGLKLDGVHDQAILPAGCCPAGSGQNRGDRCQSKEGASDSSFLYWVSVPLVPRALSRPADQASDSAVDYLTRGEAREKLMARLAAVAPLSARS